MTWNGAHLLADCLDSLGSQDLPAEEYSVLVVDNASEDTTSEVLARFPDVSVLRLPVNVGFAGGVAAALPLIDGEYVVLLNNDARATPSWLRSLLSPMESDRSVVATTSKILLGPDFLAVHPTPGVIGSVRVAGVDVTGRCLLASTGELLVPAGTTSGVLDVAYTSGQQTWSCDLSTQVGLPVINSAGLVLTDDLRACDRGYLELDLGQYNEPDEVFGFCGGAAALRRSAVEAAGGMDPYLFLYCEDLDLSWRLRQHGGRIVFAPEAVVRHLHGQSSRIGSDHFFYYNLRNRMLVLLANAAPGQLTRAVAASATSLARRALRRSVPREGLTFTHADRGPSVGVLARALGAVLRGLPHALSRRSIRKHATWTGAPLGCHDPRHSPPAP